MLITIVSLVLVGITAYWDLITKRIPNLITLPAIAIGIIINTYYTGIGGFIDALIGTAVGLLLLIIPFILGGIGAGDVKLLAAIGALNGYQFTFNAFLYSAMAGGVIAIVLALIHGKLGSVIFNSALACQNLSVSKLKIGNSAGVMPFSSNIKFPYGIAILTGTLVAFWLR